MLSACVTQVDNESRIPSGTYFEFGERQIQQDSIIFEGLAGVYFQRIFTFEESQKAKAQILSDYPPEEGTATGNYKIEDGKLKIDFNSSNTSFYKEGAVVEFDNFQVVDSTFSIDNEASTFQGKGLILMRQSPENEQIEIKNYFLLR